MNNRDSLRTQIIEAMNIHTGYGYEPGVRSFNETMFDNAIMPVLEAAMKAGELLVHRNTLPQKPVNDRIIAWLEGCCGVIGKMRELEPTVSKRELLNVLYGLEGGAKIAIDDAKGIAHHYEVQGSPLAGTTIPMKG